MKILPYAITALAALALSACNSEPEVVGGPADPNAEAAAAQNIVLPPALIASRTLRCKDNSVVYVDYFDDNVTADLRNEKTGPAIRVTAPEAGQPFVAEGGYSITGSANDETISVVQPNVPSQTCTG